MPSVAHDLRFPFPLNSPDVFVPTPAAVICPSSRSSALRRSFRLAHLSMRPTYPSARIASTSGAVGGAGTSAVPEGPAPLGFAFPILNFRVPEPAKMPHQISIV